MNQPLVCFRKQNEKYQLCESAIIKFKYLKKFCNFFNAGKLFEKRDYGKLENRGKF